MLRIAQLNGMSVLVIAGALALCFAYIHDVNSTVIGIVVAGTGAIELHGAALIRNRETRGMNWLVASQLCLLATLLGYVGWRFTHIDVSVMNTLLTDDARRQLAQSEAQTGLTEDQFLKFVYIGTYGIFGVATVFYQGGLAIYYARRREPVAAALRETQ